MALCFNERKDPDRYMMKKGFLLSVLASLTLFWACEKQPGTISVTGITLDPTAIDLVEGESATITATISPSDATNKQVRWSSSSPNIQVSNGKITTSFPAGSPTTTINGKKALGHGTITATTEDGKKKATCKVIVLAKTIAVTGVSLSETSLQLNKGDSRTLKATVQPDNATDKTVQWTSSNTSVATVDQDGTVTAVGGGDAVIKATAGSVSATCSVNVNVPVTSISLNINLITLEKGGFVILTATVSPDDAMDKNVQWSSEDPAVATVDQEGKVTAVGEGKTKITASAGGLSASCTVVCVIIPVSAIVLDKTSLTLEKGSSKTLKATVSPRDATEKTVAWSSDDPSVATVDQNGTVTAVNSGNATITASAGGLSATCEVTVTIPVTSVTLTPTDLNLMLGETAQLTASVLPEDATDKHVDWYSSDSAIVTVDEGKITAVGIGIATITAQCGNQSASCLVYVMTDSPDGVFADYFGGAFSVMDGFIQPGGYLSFGVTNMTIDSIRIKSLQLFDGESGEGSDILSIDNDLESGISAKWSIDVPATGIHSPTAVFTYTYRGEEYTCSAKYYDVVVKSLRQP